MNIISQASSVKSKTRFFQLRVLPLILQPNSFYFIENEDDDVWEGWLTDSRGKKRPIGNVAFVQSIGGSGNINANTVTDYRSSYETVDDYLYSGFTFNATYIIKRCKDNTEEIATNDVDLETDWTNRLTLTYT